MSDRKRLRKDVKRLDKAIDVLTRHRANRLAALVADVANEIDCELTTLEELERG